MSSKLNIVEELLIRLRLVLRDAKPAAGSCVAKAQARSGNDASSVSAFNDFGAGIMMYMIGQIDGNTDEKTD